MFHTEPDLSTFSRISTLSPDGWHIATAHRDSQMASGYLQLPLRQGSAQIGNQGGQLRAGLGPEKQTARNHYQHKHSSIRKGRSSPHDGRQELQPGKAN